MGTYTPLLKLYKPDPIENVNPETHINQNLRIIDSVAKGMLEYDTYSEAKEGGVNQQLLDSLPAAYRFYKPYSNSLWVSNGSLFQASQDTGAYATDWNDATPLIAAPWVQFPTQPVAYRRISVQGSGTTEIEWTGRLWQGGAAIASGVAFANVMSFSSDLAPLATKYFQANGGNTVSGYAIFRVMVDAGSFVNLFKMGTGVATSSIENYIDLGGMRYSTEVTS